MQSWAVALVILAGCSQASAPEGRVYAVMTVDWEGAQLDPDGLDAVDWLRKRAPGPITHFVSAAYFTKAEPEPVVATLVEMVQPGDELAVHLHLWSSLATASGVAPRTSPSYLTGTHEIEDYDGDAGYETDVDVYDTAELRAMLRTSRQLLEQAKLPVSRSFRMGGFLLTPKLLAALQSEGYVVDSSALDAREIDASEVLAGRVRAVWPEVTSTSQPFVVGEGIVELPIAAFADFSTSEEVTRVIDDAYAQLAKAPTRDVFVVFAFNLETGGAVAGRIGNGIEKARAAHPDLGFATVEYAAERARVALGIPPR